MPKLGIPLAAALLAINGSANAADTGDWIATWAASPQPLFAADFIAPNKVPANFWNQTLREVASISLGGDKVRLVLSNLYGSTPLHIDAAHLALAGEFGAIERVPTIPSPLMASRTSQSRPARSGSAIRWR